jgi:hypothetical protein
VTTTSTPAVANGRQRRTLNDSIAKLDQILDGLSEAIPETIRDTIRESVGAAVAEGVRAALVEIITSPDVQALLRGMVPTAATEPTSDEPPPPDEPPAPDPAGGPGLARRLLGGAGEAGAAGGRWARDKAGAVGEAVAGGARRCRDALAAARERARRLWPYRKALLVAAGVGALAVAVAVLAPGWPAAVLSGVGGACAAVAVRARLWARRAFAALAPAGG